MSIKYVCDVCGLESTHGRIEPCKQNGCRGTMRRVVYQFHEAERKCLICGRSFVPRRRNQESCGGVCSDRLDAVRRRERIREYKARRHGAYVSTRAPWFWLENTEDGRGKRMILHTLEEQTEAGVFPWPDVLSGTMPSIDDMKTGPRQASNK